MSTTQELRPGGAAKRGARRRRTGGQQGSSGLSTRLRASRTPLRPRPQQPREEAMRRDSVGAGACPGPRHRKGENRTPRLPGGSSPTNLWLPWWPSASRGVSPRPHVTAACPAPHTWPVGDEA